MAFIRACTSLMGAVKQNWKTFCCSSCVWNPNSSCGVGTTSSVGGNGKGLAVTLERLTATHHLVSIKSGSVFIFRIFSRSFPDGNHF